MTKLTDSQRAILSAAAARDDGAAVLPLRMMKAAALKVGASLVVRKLMRETRAKPVMPIWRSDEDGRGTSLIITKAGLKAAHLRIELAPQIGDGTNLDVDHHRKPNTVNVPFVVRSTARKGYLHQPQTQLAMATETSETLLKAISRARGWLDELLNGRATSFDEIAMREGLVERHVRFLMPLAFVAPRTIESIADGTAPADLTVTRLAKGLPVKWSDQAATILGA